MPENSSPAVSRCRPLASLSFFVALLLGSATGQTVSPPTEPHQPASGVGTALQDQPPPPSRKSQASPPEVPKPLTKAQAEELFRSVDEILKFVSQDTGLPIRHKVKRKLITRDKVERYVEKRLQDDKDTQRLERSQLVLKKFGLIPHDYDLHSEFLKLLSEQVAAYYDSKTKTVNLLDWVQPELQKTVLAHELTHALQDQAVDLEKFGMAGAKDDLPLPDQQEQAVEEAQAARQNVAEGQAMVAMIDYTLARAGVNILTAPDIVNAMRVAMTNSKDAPVLASAPIFLRESLLMPYTFGLDFVREVLSKKGKSAAFAAMLQRPPIDTRQVMEPETYIANQPVEPPIVPDLDKLIAPDYQRYDFGGMGEYDIYLLAKQYAPETDAKRYYTHWRGGYYLAVHAKAAPKEQIALLYFSRWDSPESANDFAKLYNSYVPKRYTLPVGTATNASIAANEAGVTAFRWDFGQQVTVAIQTHGNDVLVLEGFDDATASRIRNALLHDASPVTAGAANP